MYELTGGNSLAVIIQLVLNNAALGAKIAASL
ncbi:pseudouridine-5'-phosphate glycosidase [Aeromonas sanarellii]|nr:pseudouridine-5'-phosphate glycosidase [Aeromonas media]